RGHSRLGGDGAGIAGGSARRRLGTLEEVEKEPGSPDTHDLHARRLHREEALVLALVAVDLEDEVRVRAIDVHRILDDREVEALGELAAFRPVARVGDDDDADTPEPSESLDGLDQLGSRPDEGQTEGAVPGR